MRLRLDGYVLFGTAILLMLTPIALSYPVVAAALGAAVAALWWLAKLDWWRRFYALTLVCAIGATSNLEALATTAGYGRFVAVGLLLIASLAAYHKTAKQPLGKLQKRALGALWIIVVFAMVSTFWSVAPIETIIQTAGLGAFVCILQLLMRGRWTDMATMLRDLSAGYVVLIGSLVISLGALAAGYAPAIRGDRLQGIYDNPNIVSQMGVFALFLGWSLYRKRPAILQLALAVPAVTVLVLAESRTALVAVAVAAVWIILRSSAKVIMRVLYVGAITACLIVMSGLRPFTVALDRFGSTAGGDLLGGRLDAWEPAVRLISDQPFGYGWAASGSLFESMFGYAWFTFTSTSVHSSYLQYLVELGLLGLIPLLYLLLVFFLIAVRGPMAGPGSGLIAVVVAGVSIQIAESSMFGIGQPYPYVFWFVVAAALTIYEPKRPKQRQVLKPTHPHQTALR